MTRDNLKVYALNARPERTKRNAILWVSYNAPLLVRQINGLCSAVVAARGDDVVFLGGSGGLCSETFRRRFYRRATRARLAYVRATRRFGSTRGCLRARWIGTYER